MPQIGMYDSRLDIPVGPVIQPMDLIRERMDILCKAANMGLPLSGLLRNECLLCDSTGKYKGKTCPACNGKGKDS